MQHHVLLNDLTFKQYRHVVHFLSSVSELAIFHQLTRRTGRRVVAVPSCLVIRADETSSEGELLSDTVISVPV